MSAAKDGIQIPRAELHRRVVALREQGVTFKDIANKLNRSMSSITDAYYDPSGDKSRERKRRYAGQCVDCGCQTFNGGRAVPPKRCAECSVAHSRTLGVRREKSERLIGKGRRWTDQQCTEAIRAVAVGGRVSWGAYEAARRKGQRIPPARTLIDRFGSWRKAVHVAGLQVAHENTPATYATRMTDDQCLSGLAAYRDAFGDWPSCPQYERWSPEAGFPSAGSVRLRFGSWMNALEAAIASTEMEAAA